MEQVTVLSLKQQISSKQRDIEMCGKNVRLACLTENMKYDKRL